MQAAEPPYAQRYRDANYPALPLKVEEIAQLNWAHANPLVTPTAVVDGTTFNVRRTLNRLYALQALWERNYEAFTGNQEAASKLNPQQFNSLVARLHATIKNEEELFALRAAVIIAATTLSPESKKQMREWLAKKDPELNAALAANPELANRLASYIDERDAKKKAESLAAAKRDFPGQSAAIDRFPLIDEAFPKDSVEYLATTMERCPEIYPLYMSLSPAQRDAIKAAFPHHTHFRHMLNTEGNNGMFSVLQAKWKAADTPQKKAQLQKEIDFWAMYWIVDVAGFELHKEPNKEVQGAYFLDSGKFDDIQALLKALGEIAKEDHGAQILRPYLEDKANRLGIKADIDRRDLVAYLANWLGIAAHDRASIEALEEAWVNLDTGLKAKLAAVLEARSLTPTYVPAFLKNLKTLATDPESKKVDMTAVLELGIALYAEAFAAHIQAGITEPLSFFALGLINDGKEGKAPTPLMTHYARYQTARSFAVSVGTDGVARLTLSDRPDKPRLTATALADLIQGRAGAAAASRGAADSGATISP